MAEVCPNTQVLIMRSGCSYRHSLLSKHRCASLRLASTLLKGEDANHRQTETHAESEKQALLWLVYSQHQWGEGWLGAWGLSWAKEEHPKCGTMGKA